MKLDADEIALFDAILCMRSSAPRPRERPSTLPCPQCHGKGYRMVERTGLPRRLDCDLCAKTGAVPAGVASLWREKNPGSLR